MLTHVIKIGNLWTSIWLWNISCGHEPTVVSAGGTPAEPYSRFFKVVGQSNLFVFFCINFKNKSKLLKLTPTETAMKICLMTWINCVYI